MEDWGSRTCRLDQTVPWASCWPRRTRAFRRTVQTPSSISRDELNPYGATTQSDELQTQLQGKRGAKQGLPRRTSILCSDGTKHAGKMQLHYESTLDRVRRAAVTSMI